MAKEEKKSGFSMQGFDVSHYKQTETYVQNIDALYNQAVQEFAMIASKADIDPDKLFSFSDYPQTKAAAQQIINNLAAKMKDVIIKGSRQQWLYACQKNDAFLNYIMNTAKIPQKKIEKYQDRNLDALDAFQNRKLNGMNLSERIWNYAGQMKKQMELGIDIAVGEGHSAQVLSKELRQYLVDPDKLFRRVRDKHGNLVLSKAAKAYHPGQGKYRSSYKNAMRLTRSEINMSYRESDQLRWRQLDFVTGYEIKLSNNHTLINPKTGQPEPFTDICDELTGKYPKWFVFKGWHPQCRCHQVPIMMDRDEFNKDEFNELRAALKGTEYKKFESKNQVNDVPQAFKDYTEGILERSQGWNSQPYWIKDNFEGGNIAGGLKVSQTPPKPQKPVKTLEQKQDIQKRWNTRVSSRKFDSELQAVAIKFEDVDAIANYVGKIKTEIKAGSPVDDVAAMVQKLANKVEVKKAWDIRKEENSLGKILDNVKAWKTQYTTAELQSVSNAVEAKFKEWESQGFSQSKLQDKIKFEINFVEEKKKYSTWKVAQDAFKKKLSSVEYLVQKEVVQNSISSALAYAKTTKSPNVKLLADEVQTMLNNNQPIAKIQAKASELTTKVNKLIQDNAAKKAKKNAVKYTGDDAETFSQKRKDGAMWEVSASKADKRVRSMCSEVWMAASKEERMAAYRYTAGSSYINEPLRKLNYTGQYKGVYDGKIDAQHLTNIIERSSYDFDMWVQRGVGREAVQGVFGVDIYGRSLSEVKSMLLGKVGTEPGFSSCGNSKGAGFSDKPVTYNIYCPKGTKMLYSEPFSAFGHGAKSASWDGVEMQSLFGYEAEMILQAGTQFRVIKVDQSGGRMYIDLEVVAQ